jgi:hypothetical protein
LGYQTPDEFKRDWEKRQRLLENQLREKLANPMAQGWGVDRMALDELAADKSFCEK